MEQKTPFIAELVNGLLACAAVWFFRQEYFAFLAVFLVVWLLIFRKGILAIAGAILISLAIEFYLTGSTSEYRLTLILLLVGIVLDIAVLIVLPLVSGRGLQEPSVLDSMFFVVIGIMIAQVIRIVTCPVPIVENGTLDAIRIFSENFVCHTQYLQTALEKYPSTSTPGYWNNLVAVLLRMAVLTPWVWACFMAAFRRVNFNLARFAALLGYMVRAALGIAVVAIVPAFCLFMYTFLTFDNPLATTDPYSESFLVIYFTYRTIDILITALGAALGTR